MGLNKRKASAKKHDEKISTRHAITEKQEWKNDMSIQDQSLKADNGKRVAIVIAEQAKEK